MSCWRGRQRAEWCRRPSRRRTRARRCCRSPPHPQSDAGLETAEPGKREPPCSRRNSPSQEGSARRPVRLPEENLPLARRARRIGREGQLSVSGRTNTDIGLARDLVESAHERRPGDGPVRLPEPSGAGLPASRKYVLPSSSTQASGFVSAPPASWSAPDPGSRKTSNGRVPAVVPSVPQRVTEPSAQNAR